MSEIWGQAAQGRGERVREHLAAGGHEFRTRRNESAEFARDEQRENAHAESREPEP